MSMALEPTPPGDEPPTSPKGSSRSHVPQPISLGGGMRNGFIAVYAIMAIALAGLAVYAHIVAHRPLTSPHVIAPAIGAVWFALRLFMKLTPKA